MRARLINEIQIGEKTGLGSIGVGHVATCKAYEVCSKLHKGLDRILPLDSKIWRWSDGLENFPTIMSKVLHSLPSKLIHIIDENISDSAEEYLRTQAFYDKGDDLPIPSKYIKFDNFELVWNDRERTNMHVYTNENLGVSYVVYLVPNMERMIMYVFRKPE